jgi:hypothetical protein
MTVSSVLGITFGYVKSLGCPAGLRRLYAPLKDPDFVEFKVRCVYLFKISAFSPSLIFNTQLSARAADLRLLYYHGIILSRDNAIACFEEDVSV